MYERLVSSWLGLRMAMRIILVSDNASSRFGGEAFIPLNYFRLMRSRDVDIHLVVHARNREELTVRFPDDLSRLHFVDDTFLHKLLFRAGQQLPRRLAEATTGLLIQLTTQFAQRKVVSSLVSKLGVDVVHQPIPVSPKAPSQMVGLGVPVVIGPLNGGMEYPPAFDAHRGKLTPFFMAIGRAFANIFNLVIPGKRYAQLILVANRRTAGVLPWGVRGKIMVLVENGVDLSIWQRKAAGQPTNERIRLVFVGRLIELKAVDIVIEAISVAKNRDSISFEIIGDGPMLRPWQDLAHRLGLGAQVTFSGFLSQPNCARRLQEADVLVLPSLIECGGAVILEAMAVGLPVIATAWGGPLDYLDESCGFLIEPTSREAMVKGFSDAIVKLSESAELRDHMGEAGNTRVREHFDWERKIDQMLGLYSGLLYTGVADDPSGMPGR